MKMVADWEPWPTAPSYQFLYNNPFSQRVLPGWYQGATLFALDLGEFSLDPETVGAAPLYIPVTGFDPEGTPLPVEGQFYIFSKVPSSRGYTGFCRVIFVEVPPGYRPNTLRSQADARAAGYNLLSSDLVLLLPIL
jgi:hypothetical protein